MTVLITVASRHGSTKDIAEVIASELRKEGIRVAESSADLVKDLDRYEAVILGSAVYMGRWLPEARQFADQHLETLRAKPVWLFCSGPTGESPEPVVDCTDLVRIAADVGAKGSRTFAGRLNTDELGLKERIVVKCVGAPTGDFREWDEVRDWSREIIAALSSLEKSTDQTPAPVQAGIARKNQ